jgi:ring-1,2-phenylacetyl-CoA epoxidase subunit PaaA
MMFGPHDSASTNSEQLIRWGIKTKTNDQLRQEFINKTVPDLQLLGLTIPDPELHLDESTGNWVTGEIDWDEFKRVLSGGGPCNAERLAARREAHEQGAWVREALTAYAANYENN